MKELQPTPVTLAGPRYPARLRQRLGTGAPTLSLVVPGSGGD
jgi:hypothetical protein